MQALIDQKNAQGQRIVVECEAEHNARGRVERAQLRVTVDGEEVYNGPDGPDADRHWKPLLTAEPPKRPRAKQKKRK